MASTTLIPVKKSDKMQGIGNLMSTTFKTWKSYTWWLQIGFMLFFVNLVAFFASTGGGNEEPHFIFSIMLGIWPPISMMVMVQGAIVGEIESGTAAWVLSKPVSRPAFITSKILTNMINVTLSMIVPCAIVGYFQIPGLSFINYFNGILLIWLFVMFFLTLALMLGTLFKNRKGVMGVLLTVFMTLAMGGNLIPPEFNIALFMPGESGESAVTAMMTTGELIAPFAVILVVGLSVLFIVITYMRFNKKEL
jgi:ABC-2 type transport system permease protein